jgi:hypothetical protein
MTTRTASYIGTFPNNLIGQRDFKIVSQNILRNPNLLPRFIQYPYRPEYAKIKAIRMYRNGTRNRHSATTLKKGATHFDGYIRVEMI